MTHPVRFEAPSCILGLTGGRGQRCGIMIAGTVEAAQVLDEIAAAVPPIACLAVRPAVYRPVDTGKPRDGAGSFGCGSEHQEGNH